MEREVIGGCAAQDLAYDRDVHYMRQEHGDARRMRFCLRGRQNSRRDDEEQLGRKRFERLLRDWSRGYDRCVTQNSVILFFF